MGTAVRTSGHAAVRIVDMDAHRMRRVTCVVPLDAPRRQRRREGPPRRHEVPTQQHSLKPARGARGHGCSRKAQPEPVNEQPVSTSVRHIGDCCNGDGRQEDVLRLKEL